ncbi:MULTISPECIES: hypothetical protein [unclassified Rhizobium]|uniref:hypothetical protein n=1 Tax=unclassified Rhizobium TaxID=2613769 RepID=UPI00068B00A9|nr:MULTISPECIES: hypothetical protein [unclassified Rhizobium]MBN8949496.1 hypothetical protein [Rhizobium tropici]OJY75282.1 MAG: hypothetical protein BGP09_36450 [Rhizobium sp. 60-20]RKD70720.1 hypothetical protein BJ928_103240 [Rhizobium sp. WW_1]
MQRRILATTQGLTRILCAIALFSLGFAHHPAISSAAELPPFELAQYSLPDGSLPVICTSEKTPDGKQHGKAHVLGCEACRISAAALLPHPPTEMCDHLAFVRQDMAAPENTEFRRQLYPPNCGPRAPPVFQTPA